MISTPCEDDFRNVPAVEMPLQDYVNFLDQRDQESDFERSEKLSYIFERLKDDEGPLSFARSPPKLFKEHIKLRAAQFSLGGQLMGSTLAFQRGVRNDFGKAKTGTTSEPTCFFFGFGAVRSALLQF